VSDLVAIASFLTPPEAHALRGRLESEGIFAIVADEGVVDAIGGVRVLVQRDDAAAALRIKEKPRTPVRGTTQDFN